MSRRIILAVTIAAALFGFVAPRALAKNSDSKPAAAAALMKPKPKTPADGRVTVKVTNWREADLVELQVVESGSANWRKVLGALKAGQWTWAKVPQGKCRFRFQSGTGGVLKIKALREMSLAAFSVSIETGSTFFRFQLGLIDRLIDRTINACRVFSTTQTTRVGLRPNVATLSYAAC